MLKQSTSTEVLCFYNFYGIIIIEVEKHMKVWMFQPKHFFDEFISSGKERFEYDGSVIDDEYYRSAYAWMKWQMHMRMQLVCSTPVWVYVRAHRHSAKPDMRTYIKPKQKDFLLIECDVPIERMLVSDYSAWHSVLNNGPCCISDKEYDQVFSQRQTELSWERIFCPEAMHVYHDGDSNGEPVQQGCLPFIYRKEMVGWKQVT
jgi:Domain of unknown function (DUF3841)